MAFKTSLVVVLLAGLPGCGSSESTGATVATPYQPGAATVVSDGTSNPGACTDSSCLTAAAKCSKDQAADVIVASNGEIPDVICYGQDVTVATVPTDPVPDYTTDGNNAVLVLDGKNDGADVVGDLTISGNNAIVYGSGPDVSVIGGTVNVQKNNAIIRGVRIKGDVTIDKNNTTLVYCVIEGDLTITGNNTTVAGCDIFGKVTVSGLNTSLLGDRINGVDSVPGKNLTCKGDVRFDDANGNGVVDTSVIDGGVTEVGGPVSCG